MYKFVETMRMGVDGIDNVDLHNSRLNATRQVFWPGSTGINLSEVFENEAGQEGFKARVVYDGTGIVEKSVSPYTMRDIKTLRVVDGGDIDYRYKSVDRSAINTLLAQKGYCDDIIICRYGLLTDTSFTNIAIYDGERWLTPRTPLLCGTRRAALLSAGVIAEADLRFEHLHTAKKLCLFNAMMPFGVLEVSPENIIL